MLVFLSVFKVSGPGYQKTRSSRFFKKIQRLIAHQSYCWRPCLAQLTGAVFIVDLGGGLETSSAHYECWDRPCFVLFSAIFVLQELLSCLGKVKTSFLSFRSALKLTYYLLKYALIYLSHLDHKIKCRTKQENTLICTLQENGEESVKEIKFPIFIVFLL